MMYRLLDTGFFLFHTAFILFILAGWLFKPARRLHLAACLLTAFSWFVLGLHYGFGYCPFTDWHWTEREHLGHTNMPQSYIKFLLDAATGGDADAFWVDAATVVVFFLVVMASLWINLRPSAYFPKKDRCNEAKGLPRS